MLPAAPWMSSFANLSFSFVPKNRGVERRDGVCTSLMTFLVTGMQIISLKVARVCWRQAPDLGQHGVQLGPPVGGREGHRPAAFGAGGLPEPLFTFPSLPTGAGP